MGQQNSQAKLARGEKKRESAREREREREREGGRDTEREKDEGQPESPHGRQRRAPGLRSLVPATSQLWPLRRGHRIDWASYSSCAPVMPSQKPDSARTRRSLGRRWQRLRQKLSPAKSQATAPPAPPSLATATLEAISSEAPGNCSAGATGAGNGYTRSYFQRSARQLLRRRRVAPQALFACTEWHHVWYTKGHHILWGTQRWRDGELVKIYTRT